LGAHWQKEKASHAGERPGTLRKQFTEVVEKTTVSLAET
jgi:hypothetical protein